MAISISSTGKNLHNDTNAAKISSNAYLASFHDDQRGGLEKAIDACIAALNVDRNALHNTSLTIGASLTSNSITVTIS